MLQHESDDLGAPGYFLPEDSQFRLAKLSNHIKFLSRLAQPRMADEAREGAPPLSVGELAICLELLAEQTDLVLREVSWPAQREVAAQAPKGDAAPVVATEAPDTAAERFVFGVTLDQIDTLDRLIQTISAHGDVVASSHAAELAEHTLPVLGQAIHDGAAAVRALLDEVEAQRLGQGPRPRSGVGEERGVYGAGPARAAVENPPGPVAPQPAYPPLEYARPSRGLRLH